MTTKEYVADDAEKIGNHPLNGDEYKLAFEMPSGKKRAVKGFHPEKLADSANRMVNQELNRIAALEPYKEAVKNLLNVALTQDGSGAQAAAQVLLSAYNGIDYQLNVPDLCNLDQVNFKYVQEIFAGRVHTFKEPQTVIENGQKKFSELEERWLGLHVSNRYKYHYEQ